MFSQQNLQIAKSWKRYN